MGLLDALANRFGFARKASGQYPAWARDTADAQKWTLPNPAIFANQAHIYRALSWVGTAIDILAQTAAVTPARVLTVNNEKRSEVTNHPFEQLLNKPNPEDSRYELLNATFQQRKLNGNAYWWLNRSSEFAPPDEIWLIPPHQITPVPDGRLYLRGYLYDPGDGREIPLEPWEIVHFKAPNPFNRFLGLSALESLAVVSMSDIEMQKWNARLFGENNARLPGILAFAEMIQDADWQRMKREVGDAASKRQNMMLRGVGKGGVEWMQAASSQKDMEFLGGREFTKREVYDRLAPGLSSKLDVNSTEANSTTGAVTFKEDSVYPLHVEVASKITQKILPVYGNNLVLEFDDIRVTDRQLELQEQEAYALTHTVDEIRAKYYEDTPIGDERGKLFPAEVRNGGVKEPPPPQLQQAQQVQPPQPPNKMADELAKWQRKALKKIGHPVAFDSDEIPAHISARISAGLPACKTADDVKALFARQDEQPNRLLALLEVALKAEAEK